MQAVQFQNTSTNKWLNCDNLENLINQVKTSNEKQWTLALRTVESCAEILKRQKEIFISEVDMVQVCIYIAISSSASGTDSKTTPEQTQTVGTIARMDEKGVELTPIQSTTDTTMIKELCAAFLCDFPNAIFSITGGIPLILFVKKTQEKLFVSLNNMLRCAQNGCMEFAIAVPKV
jgi:hypothetical protein